MNHILLAGAFSLLATSTPVLAQAEGVREEFEACITLMTQACVWSLGDQALEASGSEEAGNAILDALTLCLTNPTPECAERAKTQAQQAEEQRASNPVAAAMRDVCLDDPTPECLMTFAMAYGATPIGSPYNAMIGQILPFVHEGPIVAATQEWRFVGSSSVSTANLNHARWLLAGGQLDKMGDFIAREAFTVNDRATAEKLRAVALAQAGNFDVAFTLAGALYVFDEDWADRFEMVAQIMGAYAAAAPDQALGVIEGLGGSTDQTAGLAGLTITLARSNKLDEAKVIFGRAMEGIATSVYEGARDDGYMYFARELAKAGAFDLSLTALQAIGSTMVKGWIGFDLAEEMVAAGRVDDALAMLAAEVPDPGDSRFNPLALRIGRTDPAAARAFVEGLEDPYRVPAAQGLARALVESGEVAEGFAVMEEFGSDFSDAMSFSDELPAFAAALAKQGKVSEALTLAASAPFHTMAMAFAGIALEMKGGDWESTTKLMSLD